MLEKILEEIEAYRKIACEGKNYNSAAAFEICEDIIREHMKDDKCGECSRRKWYQKGYEDGKKDNDGWIPCDERLPEDFEEVLVTDTGGRVRLITFNKFLFNHPEYMHEVKVIAWRPLPEPYRLEKGAEE